MKLVLLILLLSVVELFGCTLPSCPSQDTDVDKSIPREVTNLAHEELACAEAIDVAISPVPFAGGFKARGCGKSVVYTCRCSASKTIDSCHDQCVEPKCELYGCAEEATVTSYAANKCVWKK